MYAAASNENIPENTIRVWVLQFVEMGLTSDKICKAIKKTMLKKKFGATAFSDFIEVLEEENQLYTYSEMISKAREMANVIYHNTITIEEKKRLMESEENEKVETAKQELVKFLSNIHEKNRIVSAEINEVVCRVASKVKQFMLENDMAFVAYTIERMILSERRLS